MAIVFVAFNLLFFLLNCFIQAPCVASNLNPMPGKPCNQKANASVDIVMQKVWPWSWGLMVRRRYNSCS